VSLKNHLFLSCKFIKKDFRSLNKMKNISKFILISAAIIGLTACSAIAQNVETFVAANSGNDANACTAISPCQTIAKAISVTDPKGKIVLTQNGVYQPAAIDKPLTITAAEGIDATIRNNINIPDLEIANLFVTDTVSISNINFAGPNGIWSHSGYLSVDNCTFSVSGQGITKDGGRGLFVHNSTFRNNFRGIFVQSGNELIQVTVDSSIFEVNNTGFETVDLVRSTVSNSVFASNQFRGIQVTSPIGMGSKGELFLDNCQINQNLLGIMVKGTGRGEEVVRLSRSNFIDNFQSGLQMTLATTVYSLGNNVFGGNATDVSGGVLTPLAAK
jgi:Periplasmic copper-binding protein (NosD)